MNTVSRPTLSTVSRTKRPVARGSPVRCAPAAVVVRDAVQGSGRRSPPPVSPMNDVEQRKQWAVQACLRAHMRLTPIRGRILEFLAAQSLPTTLAEVTRAAGVGGACNAATAYRTLMLLRELEVVRQVSLPNRVSYFVLNPPGESRHFLICRCCGAIQVLPDTKSVAALVHKVAADRGYAGLSHELVIFGLCPMCQKHPPGVVCAKVQPRMRLHTRYKLDR